MPITKRTWRSGPRKIKRVAYGYTFQDKDGKQIRETDSSWTREDAEKAMAARLLNVATPKAEDVHIVTFKGMTDHFLREKDAAKKKTIRSDRNIIKRLLAAFGADTPLSEITAPKISAYRLDRLTTISPKSKGRLGAGTINRELQVIRGIVRMAASDDYGLLQKAPTVKMEKEPEGRLRYLDLIEVKTESGSRWESPEATRLLDECLKASTHPISTNRSPRLHALVVVALHTGMRKGELLGLEWPRVDFSRGVIQLEKTNAGRRREIPMNRAVYDALSALPKTGARVFPSTYRTAFEHAVVRAKLHDFTFHALRHTFASWLTMKGRPLKEVSELLGHSSVKMTERYAHLAPERLRDAVAVLEDFNTTSAHEPVAPAPQLVTTSQR
jgi:integrase